MRVRDHVAISSGAAALLYPRLGRSVVIPWAASIFIDVDHYVWFLIRYRRLNPVAAVRVFNSAEAPKHSATRPLHHPAAVLSLLLLGRHRRAAVLALLGMVFHIGLDSYHRARMAEAQAAVLNRDHLTCQVCGAQQADVVAHVWRQPALLPSYRVEHLVTVCAGCHEAAHAKGAVAIVRPSCGWESYRNGVAQRALTRPRIPAAGNQGTAAPRAYAGRDATGRITHLRSQKEHPHPVGAAPDTRRR